MEANYGGTEICLALQSVFDSRNKIRPTATFVLTDGEVCRAKVGYYIHFLTSDYIG
jgi:hypothetical protein